jgi:SLT domain-containing protein/phage-related protein
MPEGTKVGDVYVEGRLEYDARNTPAFSAALQRDLRRSMPAVASSVSQIFGDGIESGINTGFSRGMDKAQSALDRRLRSLNLKTPDLDVGVAKALADIDRVQQELVALGQTDVTANVKLDIDRAHTELMALRARISEPMKAHVDIETDPIKNKLKSALAAAFVPDPAVTEQLFETLRTGFSRSFIGIFASPAGLAIGAALVAMLGQAIVGGTIFLGAALTGAIVGGLGIGVIAAGIALVADDPQIEAAGKALADKLTSGLKAAAQPFLEPVKQSLIDFQGTVDRVMPHIQNIFAQTAPHIQGFAAAIGLAVEDIVGGLDKLLTNADPIFTAIKVGMVKIGEAIGQALEKFADPQVIAGAALALNDLTTILAGLIIMTADFLAALSKAWAELRPLFVELGAALDNIGIDGKFVADVMTLIGTVLVANLAGGIIMVTNIAKGLAIAFDAIKVAGEAVWSWVTGTLLPSLTTAGEQAKGIWDGAKEAWNSVWADIKADWIVFKDSFKPGMEEIRQAWRDLRNDINTIVQEIKSAWTDLKNDVDSLKAKFNELRTDVANTWNEITSTVVASVNNLREAVASGFDNIRSTVTNVMNQLRSDIQSGWDTIRSTVTSAIDTLRSSVESGFGAIRERITSAMNDIRSAVEQSLGAIRGVFDQAIGHIQGALTGAFNAFRDVVRNTWNENLNNIRNAWFQIRDSVFNEINSRTDDLKNRFNAMRDSLNQAFQNVRDTYGRIWNEIRDQIFNPMGDMIANQIPAKYAEFKDKVIRIFSEVRDTIGRIWTEMMTAAKGAVNALAGFVNGVIKAINAIPFMKDKLGELPGFADGGAVGKARGGAIDGGAPGTDTVPALSTWGQRYMLDNGEHILTKGDVSAMGGQQAVYEFRDALHKGLPGNYALGGRILRKAAGGRVDPKNDGLLNEHKNHVHVAMDGPPMSFPQIILKAQQSGIPHSVGSTFRPGSRGSGGGLDHHSEGRAVDFPGFNQDAFASFWEKTAGVIELIHRTATRDYAIFGGSGGGGVSAVISWLMSAAGKAVKAAFDKAMSGLKGFIGGDLLKGNTVAPGVLRNMFDHVAGQLASYFDFNASAGGGGTAAAPEQLKKWIEEATKYVGIEDVGRLITLIMRESGGNPRAINLTDSNAAKGTPSKGLMQTIDPTFQAYRDKRLPNDPFDPVANIVAGMNYIHARYGSLMNVQQANANAAPRGYAEGGAIEPLRRVMVDNGGVLPPGSEAFFKNATNETEYALTATHMRDLFGDQENGSQESTINVYVDGVRRDARTEVERNAKKVAGALRAGGRG